MSMRILCLAGICIGLSACATTHWPWADGAPGGKGYLPCPATGCKAEHAQKALSAATNYCVRIMDGYDNSRTMLGGSKVALSTVGALSGGVIAQVASGTAAKAWAGVSGVTNGMQSKMDEAFSGAHYVQRRRQVAIAAANGMADVLKIDPGKYSARVDGAMQMALGCSAAAAEADAVVLDAINKASQAPAQKAVK